MAVQRGTTFLMESGKKHHLQVVLNDPYGINGEVLIVPVCSVPAPPRDCDGSCLLAKGDHPFIGHDSYAAYNFSQVVKAADIDAGLQSNAFISKAPADDDLLWRMSAGVLESDFTPLSMKRFFEDAT